MQRFERAQVIWMGASPTRHETLIRVRRWIRDEREFGCILQKPCDVVLRDLREVIAIGVVLVEEDIVAVLVEQALMNMACPSQADQPWASA